METWMISNRQPWPEALLQGWITCKTRSEAVYLPPVGAIVFLHASKALWQGWKNLPWTKNVTVQGLDRGGVVGVAKLKATGHTNLLMPTKEMDFFMVTEPDGYVWCCADFATMVFEDVKRLPFIPCRGAQVPTRKLPKELEDWLSRNSLPF